MGTPATALVKSAWKPFLAGAGRGLQTRCAVLCVAGGFDPHWLPPPAALTSENTKLLPKFSPKTRFLPGILRVGSYEVDSARFRGCAGRPDGGARRRRGGARGHLRRGGPAAVRGRQV